MYVPNWRKEYNKKIKPGSDHEVWMTLLNGFFGVNRHHRSNSDHAHIDSKSSKRDEQQLHSDECIVLALANNNKKIKNRVGWDVSLFFKMDSKCKTFAHCVTTWSWRRPHSNKQRVLRDYGIVYQEFPKSLISLKAVEYKTRNLIMNSTFTSSTFPFRNGSTTPLAWRSAIFKCQPRHDNSSLKGKKTLNSQLMKSLGVEPTDVLNRPKKFSSKFIPDDQVGSWMNKRN